MRLEAVIYRRSDEWRLARGLYVLPAGGNDENFKIIYCYRNT